MIQDMFVNMDWKKQFALFNINELEERINQWVNSCVEVQDVFITIQAIPWFFKTLTNFTLAKFDELVLLMVLTIAYHTRSTSEHHIQILN
jgi:hypothetical protein